MNACDMPHWTGYFILSLKALLLLSVSLAALALAGYLSEKKP